MIDDQTGKERAELIGWVLGEEWRVYWGGAGVIVEPSSASKRMLKDCPCMRHHLASKPDAAYICELIGKALWRRKKAYEVKTIRSHRGDITVNIRFRDQQSGTVRYRNYRNVAPKGTDALLGALRLLRKADGDG